MNSATRHLYRNHNDFPIWALVCSILLHVFLVIFIPQLKFDAAPPQTPAIIIELVQKQEPLPEVVPAPESPPLPSSPEPEPVKPQIIPKSQPVPAAKAQPTPLPVKEEPSMIAPPSAQPEVIAVAPKSEAPHAPVVVPSSKPGPTQAELANANSNYGNTLWGAIDRHKKYPRIAQQRGWQGEVIVELSLDGNGKLMSKRIQQSSGYESLDNQAMEMVEKALPFPTPPEALRGSNFIIRIPIPFKLEPQ